MSSWLNFEAGAISKRQGGARVCIYTVDVAAADIQGPLSQFEAAAATREGTFRLIQSLTARLDKSALLK